MKSNRWWIRGTKLRVLKKHGKVYHNGVLFGWNEWEKQLNSVRTLKVGDKIFNPYLGSYTKVKQVSYRWSYKTPWDFPRLRGEFINHFAILDDHGYLIHEIGEQLNERPDYQRNKCWRHFCRNHRFPYESSHSSSQCSTRNL